MVGVTKQQRTGSHLAEVTRLEVSHYAGYSPFAKFYPVLDDENQAYAVVIIEMGDDKVRHVDIVIMARVVGDKIIIEEETTDKPLVDALMVNAGVPREQIVLAYAGETLTDDDGA